MRARFALLLLLVAASVFLPGCGYTTKTTFRDDVRTVAVPIFTNRTFYRNLEFDVTEALTKEIELRTPYKVVSQDRADTVIKGTVVRMNPNLRSVRRQGGLPQELEARLVVDFEWIDRNGAVIRQRQGLQAVHPYVPAKPAGELYEVAQHGAAQRMAKSIVDALRGDW